MYYEDMNNNTAPAVRLSRVNSGWYSYNNFRRGLSFEVIKDAGAWTVTDGAETWIVDGLDAARSFIAARLT